MTRQDQLEMKEQKETEMLYPVEHLNTLKLQMFPPHRLELKFRAL
nr:hypothetical protein [Tanacetum cinerariifolium]GFD23957.1 hypothetical protein [Tanacetum cinerariifolium]